MKKIVIILGIILVAWFGLTSLEKPSEKTEEELFNKSGQAKAVENENDLWPVYENQKTGLFLNYPSNVTLKKEDEKQVGDELSLRIEVIEIDEIEDLMGYDKESSLQNMESLKNGEYGKEVDFSLEASREIRNLGDVNAQDFVVLGRFEVCDVTFERKLMFFRNDQRIIFTVKGDKDSIIESMPEYFEKNEENCGDELIWDFEKQDQFYLDLVSGKGSDIAQEWFNSFEKVVDSIRFEDKQTIDTKSLLQGKWLSVDDDKSVIEFTADEKVDFYEDKELNRDKFQIYSSKNNQVKDDDGSHLIVSAENGDMEYTIVYVGANNLELTYLARGNTLKYKK